LKRVQEPVTIHPNETYRQVTVRLSHKGVVLRGIKLGSAIRTSKQWRVRCNQVLLSRIDARNGAIGLVPADLDGAVVTNDFWAFAVNPDLADPAFLDAYFGTEGFVDSCNGASEGTTNRVRLQPGRFLEIKIPLPSLDEQHRIVSRIGELTAKIAEAKALKAQVSALSGALVASIHINLSGPKTAKLAEILVLDERRFPVRPGNAYPQVGIKAYGAGLFEKPPVLWTETTYKEFNRLFKGALVLSQVKGWEGAVAVCPAEFAGLYASPEYRTFRCIEDRAEPLYLAAVVSTPWFQSKLVNLTRGVGARRERTRPEVFLQLEIPWPGLEQQQQAMRMFAQLGCLRDYDSETANELDALMRSILSRTFRDPH